MPSEPLLAPLLTGRSPEFDVEPVMLMEAFIDLLDDLARRAPIVLGFEDLQWADESAAELLTYVVRHVFDQRVLLVGTFRSAELPRGHPITSLISDARLRAVERIELGGLDRNDLRAFVRAARTPNPPKTSSTSSSGVRVGTRSSHPSCCTRICTGLMVCPRRSPMCWHCGSIRSPSTRLRSSRRRRCSATTRLRICWCASSTGRRAISTTHCGWPWTRRC